MLKRTVAVTIKMTEADMAKLTRAAEKLWPKAIMSRAAVVLSLALLGAEKAEGNHPRRT